MRQEQHQESVISPHYMLQTMYPPNEEVRLIDLLQVLIQQRKVIVWTLFLTIASAVIYALSITPFYRAETLFLPPMAKDIQLMSVQGVKERRKGVVEQHNGVQLAYSTYKQNLKSIRVRRNFFDSQNLKPLLMDGSDAVQNDEQLFQMFQKRLMVISNTQDKIKLSLAVEWEDPEVAARIANQFAEFVEIETVRQIVSNSQHIVQHKIRNTENEIKSKRKIAQQRREDRIANLQEAIEIAQALPEEMNANRSKKPLFYRGQHALLAEMMVLQKRESDDPFITGLRDLQEELAWLRAIEWNQDDLRAVTYDQKAIPPAQRVRPHRKKIVLLSGLIGGGLGVFLAFVINFVQKQRKEGELERRIQL